MEKLFYHLPNLVGKAAKVDGEVGIIQSFTGVRWVHIEINATGLKRRIARQAPRGSNV